MLPSPSGLLASCVMRAASRAGALPTAQLAAKICHICDILRFCVLFSLSRLLFRPSQVCPRVNMEHSLKFAKYEPLNVKHDRERVR